MFFREAEVADFLSDLFRKVWQSWNLKGPGECLRHESFLLTDVSVETGIRRRGEYRISAGERGEKFAVHGSLGRSLEARRLADLGEKIS